MRDGPPNRNLLDPPLPENDEMDAAYVPIHPELLQLHATGGGEIRALQGLVARPQTHLSMRSLEPRRSRSGSVVRGLGQNGPRSATPIDLDSNLIVRARLKATREIPQ